MRSRPPPPPGLKRFGLLPFENLPVLPDRPTILGVVFRGSVLEQLLDQLACAHVVRFSDHEPKQQAYADLAAFFDHAIAGFPPHAQPVRNEKLFNQTYLAEQLTRQQCALFDRATAAPC